MVSTQLINVVFQTTVDCTLDEKACTWDALHVAFVRTTAGVTAVSNNGSGPRSGGCSIGWFHTLLQWLSWFGIDKLTERKGTYRESRPRYRECA